MCGRYFIDNNEIKKQGFFGAVKVGEIFPSDTVPVIVAKHNKVQLVTMRWGIPSFQGNGLIINARSETVKEKSMFTYPFAKQRCLIPMSGFFEWKKTDTNKSEKYYFNIEGRSTLYVAGIYMENEEGKHCIILTTKANKSIGNYHHRMPLFIEPNKVDEWLFDENKASELLRTVPQCMNVKALGNTQLQLDLEF